MLLDPRRPQRCRHGQLHEPSRGGEHPGNRGAAAEAPPHDAAWKPTRQVSLAILATFVRFVPTTPFQKKAPARKRRKAKVAGKRQRTSRARRKSDQTESEVSPFEKGGSGGIFETDSFEQIPLNPPFSKGGSRPDELLSSFPRLRPKVPGGWGNSRRHTRESGYPGGAAVVPALDSRFRGYDEWAVLRVLGQSSFPRSPLSPPRSCGSCRRDRRG